MPRDPNKGQIFLSGTCHHSTSIFELRALRRC
jgi:hypothetical protein